jgi:hypothetical protein
MEGFEPSMSVLETDALPLGDMRVCFILCNMGVRLPDIASGVHLWWSISTLDMP